MKLIIIISTKLLYFCHNKGILRFLIILSHQIQNQIPQMTNMPIHFV
jgi:hypothetical protein